MDHTHHTHNTDDSGANIFLKRFYWTTALLVPLLALSGLGVKYLGVPDFYGRTYLGFGVSLVIFYFSLIFFEHAWHEIKSRHYGMMTLVSLAVASGFGFSVASTFLPTFGGMEFYLEISTLIWVLLFGHYLEAKSTTAAGDALKEVAKLLPKNAHVVNGEEIQELAVDQLKAGDVIQIKPGEKVPADGIIIEGSAEMNEALVTGESKSVSRKIGEMVIAGSICTDSTIRVRVERTGSESTVGQIHKLIEEAQNTKPQLQNLANRVASWLTLVALLAATLTLLIWTLIAGETFAFALTLAVTVLVIACPHALGLAIPTVSTIATSLSLKHGIFIKSLDKLEKARFVDFVVFDKTGTLTEGKPAVADIVAEDETQLLSIAASLEVESSHPLAQAIVNAAKERQIKLSKATNFKNLAGLGISGHINTNKYYLGSRALLESQSLELKKYSNHYSQLTEQGKTVAILFNDHEVVGLIAIADKIRPESKTAVQRLHQMNVAVAMITGDNLGVAKYVASELGVDNYFANVLPQDKYSKVKELQEAGHKVMVVGDGVNDAPALTQANVGVAIGAGTDVTVEAGDIILTRNNPSDIPTLLILARKVYNKMLQNLFWAVGYNLVAIPTAAGAFSSFGITLRPDVGAFLMAISSVVVVVNALQLRRVSL